MQFFLNKVLPEVVKNAQYVAAKEAMDAFVMEEVRKVVSTLPDDELSIYNKQLRRHCKSDPKAPDRMVMGVIQERADLPEMFDAGDAAAVQRVMAWMKTATPFLASTAGGAMQDLQLPTYVFMQMLPKLAELPAAAVMPLLTIAAELASQTRGDDARASLESVLTMLKGLVGDGEGDGAPKLAFDQVECLLFITGHLANKAPGSFNRLCGVKTFTGLINDGSLEDHPDKRTEFDAMMTVCVKRCKDVVPTLQTHTSEMGKQLSSFKGEPADKAKLVTTRKVWLSTLNQAQNISKLAQKFLDAKKELPEMAGVRLSWQKPPPNPKKAKANPC